MYKVITNDSSVWTVVSHSEDIIPWLESRVGCVPYVEMVYKLETEDPKWVVREVRKNFRGHTDLGKVLLWTPYYKLMRQVSSLVEDVIELPDWVR